MSECERCGVTVSDLPIEELGLSTEEAAEAMFDEHDGQTLCQGCLGGGDR
ncbi:hypothetical protein H0B56_12235 [Haloechinothrix sp. YIM 98757]|uniref:Uncharacterized protein n=1 Tax=Haloechinothrix aidingensis TaxID=2752311 RepID=A0A838AAP4_9PSEU|nr:hypothetical protein [Haloechinothrix aidingensis]MBA0126311.1 hypothetical protein [Haloechinothrix aidingensis]